MSRNVTPQTSIASRGGFVVLILISTLVSGARPAENRLWIDDQFVVPGQEDVWFAVRIANEQRIQGFQLLVVHDPTHLEFIAHSLEFTVTEGLRPEFLEVRSWDSGAIEVGCIFEWSPPFTDRALAPTNGKNAIQLRFNVEPGAFPRTLTFVDLVDDPNVSRIRNIFTVGGQSVRPELRGARVRVLDPSSAGRTFLRGDVNGNGHVELIDALLLLNYLFLSGSQPSCLDATDVADDGAITLTSGLTLLNYLFLRGPPPAPPFPGFGLDSTEDALDCP